MRDIKAKMNFTLGNDYYEKGDIINIRDVEKIIRLNEKGFIEPLTRKEIEEIRKGVLPRKREEEENE